MVLPIVLLAGCGAGGPSASPGAPGARASSASTPSATFPDPVAGQSVYDEAGVLSASVVDQLEQEIGDVEDRSGADIVLYLRVMPGATGDENLAAARVLMRQWGVGGDRNADAFVILISFDESREHGQLSTFAGANVLQSLTTEAQAQLRDDVMIPAFANQDISGGIVQGLQFVDDALR